MFSSASKKPAEMGQNNGYILNGVTKPRLVIVACHVRGKSHRPPINHFDESWNSLFLSFPQENLEAATSPLVEFPSSGFLIWYSCRTSTSLRVSLCPLYCPMRN
jgi:hypothetical protein